MNLDIISPGYANCEFNIKFAHIVGLEAAVYWSALSDALYQVRKKNKFDENGYFKLDRKYVQEKTTLTRGRQLECDQILYLAGLVMIKEDDPDTLCVDTNSYISLIKEDEEAVIKTVKDKVKQIKNRSAEFTKSTFITQKLKDRIKETDLDLRQGYYDWIDAFGGTLNAKAVEVFEAGINKYSTKKETKLKLLEIAAVNKLRNVEWAAERYEKQFMSKSVGEQKVARSLRDIDLTRKF